jgi:ubiquinone/menaquinone biosynthesis C-methylase UbiE
LIWALAGLGLVALGLFLYWALVITEGAYLGRPVVTLLYDLTPGYYDRIKEITWKRDRENLVLPLLAWLEGVKMPLILDVGTGTGRFPKAMFGEASFDGTVWGLDVSIGMLRRAQARLTPFAQRCMLIREDASTLPFPGEMFDAVVCLEVLEFTPRPEHTLSELMRVLRPGGVLLLSNRIGRARWFPGRTFTDQELIDLLCGYPLAKIEIHSWNTFYDQVWVRKAGEPSVEGRGSADWHQWIRTAAHYRLEAGVLEPG